jgi:hypothetical protein
MTTSAIARRTAGCARPKLPAWLLAAALLVPGSAFASKLNPCLRVLEFTDGRLGQAAMRTRGLCGWRPVPSQYKLAVHEQMTVMSIDFYRDGHPRWDPARKGSQTFEYVHDPQPWPKPGETTVHDTVALIYGTWWNDDPLMFSWGEGSDIAQGIWRLYKSIESDRPLYPGGVGTCKKVAYFVPKDVQLTRQSHLGAMQYLHFMTDRATPSPDTEEARQVRVADTKERALKWMEFAYAIAIGAHAPGDYLSPEEQRGLGMPSLAQNYCAEEQNIKYRTLFARASTDTAWRDRITPDVALGSMLHVMQDSFSPAHVCRVVESDGAQKRAVLKDVYNYGEQIRVKGGEAKHGALDSYPEWLQELARGSPHRYDNDPVEVGRWLIEAVDHKLSWDEVRNHPEMTIFAEPADPIDPNAECIDLS